MRTLSIAAMQTAPIARNPDATLDLLAERAPAVKAAVPHAQLLVLPELHLSAVPELLVVTTDTRANRRRLAEIERRAGDGARRPGQRNCAGIDREKAIGRERQAVIENVRCSDSSIEIKEAVVGQVDDGRPIRARGEFDRRRAGGRTRALCDAQRERHGRGHG